MALITTLLAMVAMQSGNLIANGNFANGLESWEGTGSKQVLIEDGQKYLRAVIRKKPIQPWDVAISQPIDVTLPKGKEVTIQFEARSTTFSKIVGMIEDSGQPYNRYLQSTFDLQLTWKPYQLKGVLEKDLESGSTQLTFHLGLGRGTMDIRDIRLSCAGVTVPEIKYPRTLLDTTVREGTSAHWMKEGKAAPSIQTVSSDQREFPLATKVTVDSVGNNPWDSQIGRLVEPGIRRKSIAYVKAWLRSRDNVSVMFVFEQRTAPNGKAMYESITPDGEWREYKVAVPSPVTLSEGTSQFKLFFQGKGVVDIGPVVLQDLGPRVSLAQVPQFLGPTFYKVDPAWRKRNDDEIAALRKGTLTIQLKSARGRISRNTVVKIHQDTHQFRFGTALPASMLLQDDEDGKNFRAVVKQLFNTVTFGNDLKWNAVGPDIFDDWIYPAQNWLQQNGIELRGHNLVWGSYKYLPAVDRAWSKEQTWEAMQKHVADYAAKMKDKVYVWDVVNEAVTEKELWDKVGWDKFAEVYRLTNQVDPKVKLAYNDYDMNNDRHRTEAIALANAITESGAPLDIFGDQAHLSRPVVGPERLKQIWDEISTKTGLPIEITEFDFSTFDDQLQADYVEDFYRAAFAHPKIQAIIMWGFWERDHWLANKGGHMIRADWSWRPAMKAVDNLINHVWRTDVELKTNSKGMITLPAFYGKYTITTGKKVSKVSHYDTGTLVRIL